MEALVKAFRCPPGIEVGLVHDGSNAYSMTSYAVQARFKLPNGNVLCANCNLSEWHYLRPQGSDRDNRGVHEVIAGLIGQLWYDYFIWLNHGAEPLHMVLTMEPDRRKLAQAY